MINNINKNNQIRAGAMLSYVIIALNSIVGIFYTPFLTHQLGMSEFGLYSLVISIISYMTVLDFGFGNAIVVYTSKFLNNKDYQGMNKLHGMLFIIYLLIGVLSAVLGIVIAFNVQNIFGSTLSTEEIARAKILFLILSFNMFVTFPLSIFSNILTAYENFIFIKSVNIFRVVSVPMFMTPFLISGCNSIVLVVISTVINIICLTSTYIYWKKYCCQKLRFRNFDRKLFMEILSFSILIFLSQVIDKINWGVDNLILGAICGTTAVAVYSVALLFNNVFLSLSTAISGVLLPKTSKMESSSAKDDEFSDLFVRVGRVQFMVLWFFFSSFVIFGKFFILKLFGESFEDAYIIICILIAPLLVPLIQNIGINILQAKNKLKFRTFICFFIALFNIILSVVLVKTYGVIGAAIGTGLSLLIGNGLIMNFYYKIFLHIDILKFWKEIVRILGPLIIVFIIFVVFTYWIGIDSWLVFILYAIFYCIVYCLVLYFFSLNLHEKQYLRQFMHKIHRGNQ